MRGWGFGAPYLAEAALVERVLVTYADVLKWRKDWQQLAKAFDAQDYPTLEAAKAPYARLRKAIETYLKNLADWLEYEVGIKGLHMAALVDKHRAGKPGAASEVAAVRFRSFWRSAHDQISYADPKAAEEMVSRGGWTQEQAETFVRVYAGLLDSRNGLGSSEKDEPANKAADKFFDSMREVIKQYSGGAKEWDRGDSATPRTATFMGLNFGNVEGVPEKALARFFAAAKPNLEKLKRLMPEVFYGPVSFDDQTKDRVELNGRMLSVGGYYRIGPDDVTLYRNGESFDSPGLGLVLVHELAHRFYYKFMDASQRGRWEDFFSRLRSQGVSEYSGKNAAEDFAETVMMYVAKVGNMKERDARDRLEAILMGRRLGEDRVPLTERAFRAALPIFGGRLWFLFGGKAGDGAYVVTLRLHDGRYDALVLKSNTTATGHAAQQRYADFTSADAAFIAAAADARAAGAVKKEYEGLVPVQMAELLLVKEGLSGAAFAKWYPELKGVLHQQGGTKVSCFTLVGVPPKQEDLVRKVIEAATEQLKLHGFSHLCYGEVTYTPALRRIVAADYNPSTDQMRVAPAKNAEFNEAVRTFLHELGHRQQHKFKVDAAKLDAKYDEARGARLRLHIGDAVKDPKSGRTITIDGMLAGRGGIVYRGHFDDDPSHRIKGGDFLEHWELVRGKPAEKHSFAVSAYALSKPGEFWAEVFSYAMTGRNDLLDWVKEVTK